MQEFKEHAQEEVTVPPTINHTSSAPMPTDMKSSGYVMSSSSGTSLPTEETFKMEYWGRFEVPSPASSNTDQVFIIDSLVAKIKEAKGRIKKKSFSSRFMSRSNSSKVSAASAAVEGVGADGPATAKEGLELRDDSDVVITLTASSPMQEDGEAGSTSSLSTGEPCASPEDPADEHTPCNQLTTAAVATAAAAQLNGRLRTESTDFDTLPELANLKSSMEFQALSLKRGGVGGEGGGEGGKEAQGPRVQRVRLVFSGVSVVVTAEQNQDVILKKSIRSIACCAQVRVK